LEDEKSQMEVWDIALRRGVLTINDVRQAKNLPPVEGGNLNFVLIPGSGAVLISKIEEMADRVSQGAKYGDVMSTVDMKTPAKGVRPLDVNQTSLKAMTTEDNKAFALLINPDEPFPDMPAHEKELVRSVLEKMVINVDDIGLVLGDEVA
jgi:hypothetical protein